MRNAAESGVISGRVVLFARIPRGDLNESSGVSRGLKIITGHFILIRGPARRSIYIYIGTPGVGLLKRDSAGVTECAPRAKAWDSPTYPRARASFYYCEKLFQGSSYFRGRAEGRGEEGVGDKTFPERSLAGELPGLTAHLPATTNFASKVTALLARAARVALN